jgi:hypothetical protein
MVLLFDKAVSSSHLVLLLISGKINMKVKQINICKDTIMHSSRQRNILAFLYKWHEAVETSVRTAENQTESPTGDTRDINSKL